jgi:hypothetical protein
MMPARWVPLLYLAFAHLSLAAALATLVATPRSLAGYYYHPRMLAVVHLVTLGWISASILGALYLIGPLALRMPLPARRADYAAFAGFAVGVVGMSGHFWIDRPRGTAWAACLLTAAMAYVAARGLAGLRRAPVPLEARLPVALALLNMLAAAGLGVLVAVNKVAPFLAIAHLDAMLAHAHLAAIGWGTMMVVGAGYRMLPMILPAAMPRGPVAYASALLLEGGVVALVCSFLAGRGQFPAAVLVVAGLLAFLSRVVWMLRHRRPAPSELRRPDWGTAHALQAFAYLLGACGLGLYLAWADPSETTLALASVYGVLGLVGFLTQIVVGVESRVLPLFAWLWGFSDRGHAEMPPSLHAAPVRRLQALSFVSWTAGVPLLALGLGSDRVAMVSLGAAGLLVAVLANVANTIVVFFRLWRRPAAAPVRRAPFAP